MMVKDVANFFSNLAGFDHRAMADFYDEDGFYIGHINRNDKSGNLSISGELRVCWRNNIKFYSMYILQETVMFTFIVLKGEEK